MIISLKEARLSGMPRYFTGVPCKHGHAAERYTRTQICVVCCKQYNDARDPAKMARLCFSWRQRNDGARRIYKQANSVKDAEQQRIRYLRDLARFRADGRYRAMLRHARKKRACPQWADLEEIKTFYAACPPGMQVDHVVPLAGVSVSGLHVLDNFQYLPEQENRKKGNRHAA